MKPMTTLSVFLFLTLCLSGCWKKKTDTPEGEQKNVASVTSPTMLAAASTTEKEDTMPSDMKSEDIPSSIDIEKEKDSAKEDMMKEKEDKVEEKVEDKAEDKAEDDKKVDKKVDNKVADISNMYAGSKKLGNNKDMPETI